MKITHTPKVHQGFHRMGSRYGRLFDRERFLGRDLWDENRMSPDTHPYANIKLTDDAHHIEIATPGYKKSDLSLTISNNVLTVRGQKTICEQDASEFIRQEFNLDSFKRVFELTPEIDTDNIKAHYENGLLTIRLMCQPETKNKTASKKIVVD